MDQIYASLGAGWGAAPIRGQGSGQPCIATAFTRHLWPGYVPLDAPIARPATDHLVALAELPWQGRLDALFDHLRLRLDTLQGDAPGLACLI